MHTTEPPPVAISRTTLWATLRARTAWLFDLWGPAGGIANASDCTHAPHHNNSISVRYSMFAIDAPGKSQLAIAISMLAGYRTEPQHLWSAGPVKSKTRVPLCAARTLENATGRSRATLSLL